LGCLAQSRNDAKEDAKKLIGSFFAPSFASLRLCARDLKKH